MDSNGIQMYHEEMQVKIEYGCDPIIFEGVIALGLRNLLENEFPFIFSLIVRWIEIIFSITMYHEEMQVNLNMGAARLLLEKLLPLDSENFLKITVSVHFLSDGWMNS
jgi:hypothetical protein